MDSYAIWAIGLGGIILLFEAYTQYSTADAVDNLKSNNQPSRKELENVRMTALTTDAENWRGRAIYMLMFALLYVVILISPEMVSVFLASGTQTDAVSGGTSHLARSIVNPGDQTGDATPLSDPKSLPFWLAMAITVGATSPTFQVVERKLRGIAYFFAGVPRNIYRVLQSLEELNYTKYSATGQTPLLQAFLEKQRENKHDPIMDGTVQSIEGALRCIDLLQGPIIGPQRSAFRQLFTDDTPLARIEHMSSRYNRIRATIRELSMDEKAINELHEEAMELTSSMQCLFALYAIRSRKIPEALEGTPSAAIIERITEDKTAQSLHDISLASVFGAVFSYLIVERMALMSIDPGLVDRAEIARNISAEMMIPLIPALILLAFLTILFRHLKVDQGAWPPREPGQIPFWDYATLAIIPASCATLLYGIVTCLGAEGVMRHGMSGDFNAMIEASGRFLSAEIGQLPRVLFMSFVAACAILFLADQHNQMRWYVTAGAALIASVFLWMVATLAASLFGMAPPGSGVTLGDMAIMITLPFAVFLTLYAGAAEIAEKNSVKLVFSAVTTPFRGQQNGG